MSIYATKIPPMRWWGRYFIGRTPRGEWEHVIQLRLPWWGVGYHIGIDIPAWGQRVLMWRSKSGFSLVWMF